MQFLPALTDSALVSQPFWAVGGKTSLYFEGTWNGATVTLTYSPDNVKPYVPIGSGVAVTANGTTMYYFEAGYVIATMTNPSTSSVVVGYALTHTGTAPLAPGVA